MIQQDYEKESFVIFLVFSINNGISERNAHKGLLMAISGLLSLGLADIQKRKGLYQSVLFSAGILIS